MKQTKGYPCMIKGHDSREEEEEESAVRGACNLVSLFFLETGGRGAGRAVRRPTATTVSSDSWVLRQVNTQQQKNDRHCFEFVQHHMMTILSVELHGLWVSVERMNPLKCNLPLPSIGINHNHLSLVKSHRATEEADQSHRPSVVRLPPPAFSIDHRASGRSGQTIDLAGSVKKCERKK